MRMQHFLIEGYCDGKEGEKNYACEGTLTFGLYCIRCPQFSYTKCPNEISVSDNEGLIKEQVDYIGFGGEMEPTNIEKREEYISIWNNICRKKIKEAYEEYISCISIKRS